MTVLGLECSAVSASCALMRDELLLCESFSSVRLTHSQTLLPMVESMLKQAGISLNEVDCFAVSCGPGSFTGLRIGIAAVKGMAQALGKPTVGVSTLEAMAKGFAGEGIVVPAMDARCGQTYTAIFRGTERLTEDLAIPVSELGERLEVLGEPATLIGDGAAMVYDKLSGKIPLILAPEHRRMPRAAGVCLAALTGTPVPPGELVPVYLRLPQAERERLARENAQKQ